MNFIILSHARSGSTWLVNTLNNIEGVNCYGELFLNKATLYQDGEIQMPRFLLWRQKNTGLRPFTTYRYLNEVCAGKGSIGFKLMYPQLRKFLETATFAISKKMAVVHLVRKNILDSVLSSLVAKERGQFHYKGQDEIPIEEAINVDTDHLIRSISRINKTTEMARLFLRISQLIQIEINYEDLLADKQNFKPIWDFLGEDFDKHPPSWHLKKSRKKSPRETIINYKEVHAALAQNGYEHFLY